uniref:Uncharacterized protein n=1 Tax=Anopheles albimanus TaxID=7167 RepID=A0A182FXW4_ANOAL
MGNHLPSRLTALFGFAKSPHASDSQPGEAAVVGGIRTEETALVRGHDSAGNGSGNNSAKVGRNYSLIESPAGPSGQPGPDRSIGVKGQQSRGVQTSTAQQRPSDATVARERTVDQPPAPLTATNRRLERVRSFFLPSRTSKKQGEEATGQQQQQQQHVRRADSTRRSRFRFYTVRRKPAAVTQSQGTEGEHALLPGGQGRQRTNQWIHRLPGDTDVPVRECHERASIVKEVPGNRGADEGEATPVAKTQVCVWFGSIGSARDPP